MTLWSEGRNRNNLNRKPRVGPRPPKTQGVVKDMAVEPEPEPKPKPKKKAAKKPASGK